MLLAGCFLFILLKNQFKSSNFSNRAILNCRNLIHNGFDKIYLFFLNYLDSINKYF